MNWLDLFITILGGIWLIKGLFDGMIKQVISLISLICAIFFAGRLASPVRDFLLAKSIISNTFPHYVITGLCYVIAFSLIIIVLYWMGKLLEQAIKVTPVASLNRLLGGIFCLFKILLVLSLIFNLLTVFDHNSRLIRKQTQSESVLFNKVKAIVPFIYPFIKDYLWKQDISPKEKEADLQENVLVLS